MCLGYWFKVEMKPITKMTNEDNMETARDSHMAVEMMKKRRKSSQPKITNGWLCVVRQIS